MYDYPDYFELVQPTLHDAACSESVVTNSNTEQQHKGTK